MTMPNRVLYISSLTHSLFMLLTLSVPPNLGFLGVYYIGQIILGSTDGPPPRQCCVFKVSDLGFSPINL